MRTEHVLPDGNKIIVESVSPLTSNIHIQNGGKTVLAGSLHYPTGELKVFKKRAIHEHHRTQSYGFNYNLLTQSKHIKKIRIFEENGGYNAEYLVDKQIILELGTVMNFIGEKQIFFKISLLEQFYKL